MLISPDSVMFIFRRRWPTAASLHASRQKGTGEVAGPKRGKEDLRSAVGRV